MSEHCKTNHGGIPAASQRRPGGTLGGFLGLGIVLTLTACGGSGDAGAARQELGYCDVEPVIERYCVRCHADPTEHHAPFPLTSWEATQGESAGGVPIWERMRSAVSTGFMPFQGLALDPPVEPLPADEEAMLLDWLDAGAPRGDGVCGD